MACTPVVVNLTDDSLKPGSSSWLSACTAIRHALEEHGFFMAEYDGLPLQLHQDILSDTEQLFHLPHDTKIKNTSDKPTHGYVGNIAALPLHEGLGIDKPNNIQNCTDFSNLMWPESGNQRFSETAHMYAAVLSELEQTVARMLFESYRLGKEQCDAHVRSTSYLLRFLSYRKPESDEGKVAFVTHTDKSFISILHQNHVRGLELQMGDGNWVGFEPSPTSFVVLAGDACMAWSNDRVKPCYHRVVMEGPCSSPRYSLGFFSFQIGVIATPEELVDEDHPLQYKPFDHLGLLNFYDTVNSRMRASHNIIKAYCGASII